MLLQGAQVALLAQNAFSCGSIVNFRFGEYVTLTPDGARQNRQYRKTKRRLIGAGIGAVALPVLIPGAGVGIAAGGTAFGLAEPIQGAVGAVLGGLTGGLGEDPESGDIGVVTESKQRLSGNNVRVRWNIKRTGQDDVIKEFWHNPEHLKKIPKR